MVVAEAEEASAGMEEDGLAQPPRTWFAALNNDNMANII